MVSRRAVLLAGGLGIAALAGCASDRPAGVPDVSDGRIESGSFHSRYRHTDVGWAIAMPPGHEHGALPVLIALHGRGGSHADMVGGGLYLDRFLARAVRHGVAPFAVAAPDGGDHEYWHPRAGTDPAGMVLREFLPLLAERGLRTDRIALLGMSMGGYGALYLAGVLGRTRVAAAVAESPAIWEQPGQSADGAFDDASDFMRHRIFGRLGRLRGIPLRVDCGAQDGFAPVTRVLRARLHPTPAGGIQPGGHDFDYWRRRAPAQLAFVGRHLG